MAGRVSGDGVRLGDKGGGHGVSSGGDWPGPIRAFMDGRGTVGDRCSEGGFSRNPMLCGRATDGPLLEGRATPYQNSGISAGIVAAITSYRHLRDQTVSGALRSNMRTRRLVDQAHAWIESHACDEALSVDTLAFALNMSRTSLHRKLVSATGQPPGEFIRNIRLRLARRLLRDGAGNVSEIAYAVGFVSLSGFSRAYRARYGEPPSSSRPHVEPGVRHGQGDWRRSKDK